MRAATDYATRWIILSLGGWFILVASLLLVVPRFHEIVVAHEVHLPQLSWYVFRLAELVRSNWPLLPLMALVLLGQWYLLRALYRRGRSRRFWGIGLVLLPLVLLALVIIAVALPMSDALSQATAA